MMGIDMPSVPAEMVKMKGCKYEGYIAFHKSVMHNGQRPHS